MAREDSAIWRWFTDPGVRARHPVEDHEAMGRVWTADLRVATSRHPGDAEVQGMVDGLLARSTEFAELWARHEVAIARSRVKRIIHPEHGLLTLDCENFESPLRLTLQLSQVAGSACTPDRQRVKASTRLQRTVPPEAASSCAASSTGSVVGPSWPTRRLSNSSTFDCPTGQRSTARHGPRFS